MISKMLDTLSPVEILNSVSLRRAGLAARIIQLSSLVFALTVSNSAKAGSGFVTEEEISNIDSVCTSYFQSAMDKRQALDRCTSTAVSCVTEQHDKNRTVDMGYCVSRGKMAGDEVVASQRQNQNNQSGTNQTNASSSAKPPADPRLAACLQTTENAKNFCKDPLKYSSDGEINVGSRDNAVMATNLMMVGGMVGTSNKGICEFMKKGGVGITGLNATFAARCNSFISDCETACEEGRRPTGDGNDSRRAEFADAKLRSCRAQRDRAAEMTGSAMQSFYASQAGKLCADALEKPKITGAGPPPEFAPGGTNCVTDPSNPLCAGGNNYAGGGSGAGFSDGTGGNGGRGNASDGGAGSGGGANGFNVDGVEGAIGQVGPRGSGSGTENKNGGVPNGGGGMVGGGGSGGGAAGDERAGRGGGGSGVNANVLQGERGGGGYSVSPGGGFASSGGWSGYGNGSESTQKGSGFDLSKFLPGQNHVPMRGPAGLNRAGVEVAPMHEDIFQKISDRVRVVCKTNRLRDCN